MDTLFIIFTVLIILAIVLTAFFISQKIKALREELKANTTDPVLLERLKFITETSDKSTELLLKQLAEQRNAIDNQLKNQNDTLQNQLKGQRDAMTEQTKLVWQRLDSAQEVIRNVSNQLGGINEFGKDIKDLSNILRSPKLRGGLGEQFLNEILASNLPHNLYELQYCFKDGLKCDAAIFTEKGIIPIDSKFSMERYKAMVTDESDILREQAKKAFIIDVKKRIEETSKYIKIDENTTEQAVMYIPSESIFYEIIVTMPEIEEYARTKNVVMTSPNTINYFLKVILVAYQQKELAKHTHVILKQLSGLKKDAVKIEDDLGVLEKHISNSYRNMGDIKNRYVKFLNKMDTIHEIEDKVAQEALDLPIEKDSE